MTFSMEYYVGVNRPARRSVPASPIVFGIFLLSLFLVSAASAQYVSVTGSVAPRTGGVAPPTASYVPPPTGAAAFRTSVPFVNNGYVPVSSGTVHVGEIPHSPGHSHNGSNGHHDPHHSANGVAYYPYIYGVPVPYSMDVAGPGNPDGDSDDDNDPEYQGGPTIFDRRGSGAASYVPLAPPRPPNSDVLAQSESRAGARASASSHHPGFQGWSPARSSQLRHRGFHALRSDTRASPQGRARRTRSLCHSETKR